jgi:hypothetical protein
MRVAFAFGARTDVSDYISQYDKLKVLLNSVVRGNMEAKSTDCVQARVSKSF